MSRERTGFTKHINKESKYWGLSITGLGIGAVTGLLVLTKLELMFGILSSIGGFFVGAFISGAWLKGRVQRWVYRNLPLHKQIRGRFIPPSYKRTFM